MNKHGVLLGSLGTLVLIIGLGLSFTWVNAQDTKIFVPFLNGQDEQQDIPAANTSDMDDRSASETAEAEPLQPFDSPKPGEIRPVPVESLPTASPITQEEEAEMRKALEEMGPEKIELFVVVGPETKGQKTLIRDVGLVNLPPDVWVDFHGRIMCTIEMLENDDCITGPFTVIKRDNSKEELFLQSGLPLFTKAHDEAKVREAYANVLALIERVKSEDASQ